MKKARGSAIDTTSRASGWSRGLSPFFLGPVKLWGGHVARNVENAWQYSKVYQEHVKDHAAWLAWAQAGWARPYAVRYPKGRGASPVHCYWDGEELDYIEARKRIYIPVYRTAVQRSAAYKHLWRVAQGSTEPLTLWSFDAYDHRKLDMDWRDVIRDPSRKMGHGFVLGMMLETGCEPI